MFAFPLIRRGNWRARRLTIPEQYHNESVLKKFKPKLCIGQVQAEAKL